MTGEEQPRERVRRRRLRLSDEVANHVRELIISGQLRPGEFIRPEHVADELGLSATPAREGLLSLQSEGFLKVEPRRGFKVTPLSGKDISDMFNAQALLAGELAARAAAAMTPENLATLENIQQRLETAAGQGDFEELEQLNFEFHRLLYRFADAPKISWLLGATLGYAPRRFYPTIEGWPEATIHDHHQVLDALRAGDGETARTAITDHILSAGKLLAKHFDAAKRPNE